MKLWVISGKLDLLIEKAFQSLNHDPFSALPQTRLTITQPLCCTPRTHAGLQTIPKNFTFHINRWKLKPQIKTPKMKRNIFDPSKCDCQILLYWLPPFSICELYPDKTIQQMCLQLTSWFSYPVSDPKPEPVIGINADSPTHSIKLNCN